MIIISPLEQFTIIPIIILSNILLFIIYILIIIIIIIPLINKFLLYKHIEWWYQNLSIQWDHIFILITIFLLIFFSNIIGMLPYSFTITAQFILVLSISIITFFSLNILGFKLHKFYLFYLFLPSGVPLIFIPIISLLEFFLYFTRIISLSLRLSANLLSGHILLKILIYSFIQIPFFSFLIIPIIFLELFVAFLQSYIYLILIISYYKDISLPH